MKRNVVLKKVLETKRGVSQRGEWQRTELVVAWIQEEPNCESYECSMVVSTSQPLDEAKMASLIESGTSFDLRYYPGVHEYNNRFYNEIRGYLPADFLEAKPL